MNTEKIEIVEVSDDDADSFLALLKEYLPEQSRMEKSFETVDNWIQECKKYMKKIFSNENYQIMFIKCNDEIAGFISFGINFEPLFVQSKQGYIADIFVKEKFRRKGLGKKLALNAIETLKKKEVDNIQLNSLKSHGGTLKFWKELGFETFIHRMKLEI